MFYFDVMVTAAARQGVGYHMWLYYLPYFAECLEKRYDSGGEGIDQTAEFPTCAARLLYELVRHLKSWVALFEHLPDESPHRRFPEHFEGVATIPHAASLALGSVLATVVRSPRLDPNVVQMLHDIVIRAIRDFHIDGADQSRMRAFLIEAILRGGYRRGDFVYWDRLAILLDETDHVLRAEVPDYLNALNGRLGI